MKRTLIVIALIAALIAPIWAQASGTTPDGFQWSRTSNGTGIIIDFYEGTATTVSIPARINNLPVVEIGEGAFAYNSLYITSVVILGSVTKIGSSAFERQTRLASINFPGSLVEIGQSAFKSCYSLTSIDLSRCGGFTTLGYGAFSDCQGLTSVRFGNRITTIGNYAFRGCTALTDFNTSAARITFGTNVFEGTILNEASRRRLTAVGYTGPF